MGVGTGLGKADTGVEDGIVGPGPGGGDRPGGAGSGTEVAGGVADDGAEGTGCHTPISGT
jgi:hypothetical protein